MCRSRDQSPHQGGPYLKTCASCTLTWQTKRVRVHKRSEGMRVDLLHEHTCSVADPKKHAGQPHVPGMTEFQSHLLQLTHHLGFSFRSTRHPFGKYARKPKHYMAPAWSAT